MIGPDLLVATVSMTSGLSVQPLLAVGVVNGVFLGAGALIAAPLLIHWLARRRYRPIRWAAMQFLLEADKRVRRRRQVEQWLLILLRTLAMLLLVMIFARPFFDAQSWLGGLGGGATMDRIIVIDDSASLAAQSTSENDFARVRETARRLLDALLESEHAGRVTLLRTTAPEVAVADVATLDALSHTDLVNDLDQLEVQPLPDDFPAVSRVVARRIAAAPGGRASQVYVISDLPKATLGSQAAVEDPFAALRVLDAEQVELVFAPIRDAALPNVAIERVAFRRPTVVAGFSTEVEVTLRNYGPRPVDRLMVNFAVDGERLPRTATVSLPANVAQTVSVEVVFPDPGARILSAEIEASDALLLDDRFSISAEVRPALSVLVVNGAPSIDPQADEVYLLQRALAPPGPFSSGMNVDVIGPNELAGIDLEAVDAVLLCNVASLGATELGALRRYVEQGGGLGIFLGDSAADIEPFNRAFYEDGAGVLPLPLRALVDTRLDPVTMRQAAAHPLTAAFVDDDGSLGPQVRFERFFATATPEASEGDAVVNTPSPNGAPNDQDPAPAPRSDVRVLATFTDSVSSPALIEREIGAGRAVLMTTSVDADWSNWPATIDGSYVITMIELVHHLTRRSDLPPSLETGSDPALTAPVGRYRPELTVRPPSYPEAPEQRIFGATTGRGIDAVMTWQLPAPTELGTYQFERAAGNAPLSVNRVPANLALLESDLTPVDDADFVLRLGSLPHRIERATDAFGERAGQRQELWQLLLALLVGTLLLEQFLAWLFSRGDVVGHAARQRSLPTARGPGSVRRLPS